MKAISKMALFRLGVIGPLISRDRLNKGELKTLICGLASQTYNIPESKRAHLNESTVERWYYAWKEGGVDALEPKTRKDSGHSRLSTEIQEAILTAKKEDPTRSLNRVIKTLELNNVTGKGKLSRSSTYRLLKSNRLNLRAVVDSETIERRRFVAEKCGDIWQADVLHGPSISIQGKYRKTYLVSFMDDASRLITHSEFRLGETELDIQVALKQALLKRGIPSRIIIDNGSAYRSGQLKTICARLKIHLVYCRPYEPQGKGKLEKWHSRFRDEFLGELDLTKVHGLNDLNSRLWAYLDQSYHVTPHHGFENKITPIERWRKDVAHIRQLGLWAMEIDDIFYHREKRRVRKDGCVSLHGKFFEVPHGLSGDYVTVVYEPESSEVRWVESLDGKKIGGAVLLNQLSNTHRKRQRPEKEESSTSSQPNRKLESPIEIMLDNQGKTLLIKDSKEK